MGPMHMTRARTAIAALGAGVLASATLLVGPSATAGPIVSGGPTVNCVGLVPPIPAVTGTYRFKTLIVADGVSAARANAVASRAASKIFGPAGITFEYAVTTTSYSGSVQTGAIFTWLNSNYGYQLANGSVDAIHMITSKNIASDQGLAATDGEADCVGGMQYQGRPTHPSTNAYAISEDPSDTKVSARLMGHEIAHLLGAGHQTSDCVTPVPAIATQGLGETGGPCTLLTPVSQLRSDVVDPVNAAIMRAYARDHGR